MEVAGLAFGTAGLVTLFDGCLRGFELFEQGKDFSRDHTIMMTRLDAQRVIFKIWGDAVGLSRDPTHSEPTSSLEQQLQDTIKRHLECISMIFEDATQLSQKYGAKPLKDSVRQRSLSRDTSLPLRPYLSWFQKTTSRKRKAKWAIRDCNKFRSMLNDLSELISELREITSSVADIQRQRKVFMDGIADRGSAQRRGSSIIKCCKRTPNCADRGRHDHQVFSTSECTS